MKSKQEFAGRGNYPPDEGGKNAGSSAAATICIVALIASISASDNARENKKGLKDFIPRPLELRLDS